MISQFYEYRGVINVMHTTITELHLVENETFDSY